MKLQYNTTVSAPPSRVASALADNDFVATKVAASGALDHSVDVTADPSGGFTITTRRTMPTDALPGQARALVGAKVEIRTVEVWQGPEDDSSRRATVVVEVTGAPVRMAGTIRLTPVGDTSSEIRYDGDVKASVPLFGAKIEEAAGPALESAIAADTAALIAWISDHGTGATP